MMIVRTSVINMMSTRITAQLTRSHAPLSRTTAAAVPPHPRKSQPQNKSQDIRLSRFLRTFLHFFPDARRHVFLPTRSFFDYITLEPYTISESSSTSIYSLSACSRHFSTKFHSWSCTSGEYHEGQSCDED